jgi:large subunit ribosomal protein L3
MVNGIVGKKLGMTQVFDETGRLVPVTVIEAGPCVVTQVKTAEKDGYEGVQVAFGDVKERREQAAEAGHFAKAGAPAKRYVREVPVDGVDDVTPGQEIRATYSRSGAGEGHGYLQGQGLSPERSSGGTSTEPI